MLRQLTETINCLFTLQQGQFSFKEADFIIFKHDHSQRLLDSFFDVAQLGITVAFVFRVLFLRSKNAILDLILPFVIMMVISLFYYINKNTSQMKHYFHIVLIPIVGLLTARKTISQNMNQFFLNESFASWLIMMMFGSFSSLQQWYQVVGINFLCFFAYITIVFRNYGLQGVGNDFYVHITTTIIFSACLIRMNELNLRNSFNLLSLSKIQEKKWQSVLTLLTDGVLIMQHSENEKGILLINSSLQKIFGKQMKIDEIKEQEENINQMHTCGKNKNQQSHEQSFQKYFNQEEKKESQKLQANAQKSGGINIAFNINQSLCTACECELKQQFEEQNRKKNQQEKITNKTRFNEKKVEPMFDNLFRTVQFKIVYSEKTKNGQNNHKHLSKEVQFMNDFICKQLDYFQKHHPQGYSENFLLKIFDPNRIIELNIIKLDSENQVLFLFKEVSIYNRLSKARTTEKFSNILINSIAHNLFTPLNAMIQLTKSMSDLILGINDMADKNVQMLGICLQQLVFTTHNILEMSKIKQGRFMANNKPINVTEKTLNIFEFFKDDMKFRETEYELKIQEKIKTFQVNIDDSRFSIVLYNLISNGVKHTSGGCIKVSIKIINYEEFTKKCEKIKKQKTEDINQNKNQIFNNQSSRDDEISFTSSEKIVPSTAIKVASADELLNENSLQEKIYLQVSVNDTGVGMDHDQKKKCFKLFGNLKIKQDVNQGGMGLGLASASLICKALNGELHLIRSEKNEGSKFKFILPITLGTLIIPKKSSEDSSEEGSDNSSSNHNNQQDVDNFEKKKAEIIENIRKKQQKKADTDSDQSENDESYESESEQDTILQEYREKQDEIKDKIQSCDVNKESSLSDEYFDEDEENESSNEFIIKDLSLLRKQNQSICNSKLLINNELSSQNFNNNNNLKESLMFYNETQKQQSIFDDFKSDSGIFKLKYDAQILKQRFEEADDDKDKQLKILQRINPFVKSSNPGQMSINTVGLLTTNFIEKKNDSDTPSSPKSSQI